MMEDPEESRLDHSLRDKFEDYAPLPSAHVWAGIEQRLPPVHPAARRRRRRPLPVPLLLVLTALLAGLGGWLLPHPVRQAASMTEPAVTARATAGAAATPAGGSAARRVAPDRAWGRKPAATPPLTGPSQPTMWPNQSLTGRPAPAVAFNPTPSAHNQPPTGQTASSATRKPRPLGVPGETSPALTSGLPASRVASADSLAPAATQRLPLPATRSLASPLDSVPAALRVLVALERQTLVQLPRLDPPAPGQLAADRRAALVGSLRAERAELLRLQRRTDSTLRALGEGLPAAPLAARPDTAHQSASTHRLLPPHRWSLAFSATPEQNTLTLQGPEGDPLTALRRNHEAGRAGLNAALLADYRLTPRLSLGAGLGYSTYGAELRLTTKTTDVRVTYDTTTTRTTTAFTATYRTHAIRIIQLPQLSPVFNGSGQVLRYDTVYVPRPDTVFTTTVQHDSVHAIRKTITPLIRQHETTVFKTLRPTYRFATVPVLLRYRLTPGTGRWWTEVAVGAQLQVFLGGTQLVTTDGQLFHTEAIGAGAGPFRRVNVALSGALALNHALTNRLSVSVAPSMRWQALSLYKPETGLRQQPTATGVQVGLRWAL